MPGCNAPSVCKSSVLKVIHLPPYASFEVVFCLQRYSYSWYVCSSSKNRHIKTSVQTTSRGYQSQLRLSLRLARLFLDNCFTIFFGQGHSKGWSPASAERIWGETLNFVWRILGELLGKVALQKISVKNMFLNVLVSIVSLANWFPDLTKNNMKIAVFVDVFSGILRGAFPRSPCRALSQLFKCYGMTFCDRDKLEKARDDLWAKGASSMDQKQYGDFRDEFALQQVHTQVSQRILPANFSREYSALLLQGFRTPPAPRENARPRLSAFFRWIQEGFTAEPPRNDSGANFQWNDSDSGPQVRVTARKSELQTKSQSYSWAASQNPNRIAPKRNPNRV